MAAYSQLRSNNHIGEVGISRNNLLSEIHKRVCESMLVTFADYRYECDRLSLSGYSADFKPVADGIQSPQYVAYLDCEGKLGFVEYSPSMTRVEGWTYSY